MKKEIENRKQNNKDLSNEDIKNIVNDVLKENGLNKILNDNQINTINNIMINVSQSDILNKDPKAYEKQAKDLVNNIQNKAKDLNNEENRKIFTETWGCNR